ncbi:MAG: dienelactone hydrolase family protein, partial [Acetobacteraceae bacterium]|nr:dienelactone hydrolase family protein [Acetobacteraceae bacterium]
MVRWFQRFMGGLALLVAFAAAAGAAGERVSFPGAGPTAGMTLSATLYRATVPGRGPAVVLLHTCAGITPFEEDWAAWFAAHGYHALVVDSFKPRFVVSVCLHPGAPTPNDRAFDALGALAWLRTQPEVDPARIGAIGWSHGGGTALAADVPLMVANAGVAGGGFRAVAALYPTCRMVRPTALAAPLLLLTGGKDEWTPPSTCDALVAGLAPGSPAVTRTTYPEATHAFDNPRTDGHRVSANGAMFYLRYDSSAAADAH